MSIKLRRIRYLGNNWTLFAWVVVFFPVAVLLFLLDAVLIEEEITPEELERLDRGS